jgi:hypothetical protein
MTVGDFGLRDSIHERLCVLITRSEEAMLRETFISVIKKSGFIQHHV